MSFPVNSYPVHAQRVMKFEGLGADWTFITAHYFCKGKRAVTGFTVAPRDIVNMTVPGRVTGFTRQPNTTFTKPAIRRGQC